jgi:hypothetical protein
VIVRRLIVVSVGVIAVAGCGDDDPAATATATAPAPAAKGAPTAKPAPAATTPKTTPTGPAAGKSRRKPVAPGGKNDGPRKTYSGDGSGPLPLELKRSAVLRWTASGKRFRLTDPSGRLRITGGARGQTFAPAGKYPRARVTADGKWRLTVELLAAP